MKRTREWRVLLVQASFLVCGRLGGYSRKKWVVDGTKVIGREEGKRCGRAAGRASCPTNATITATHCSLCSNDCYIFGEGELPAFRRNVRHSL